MGASEETLKLLTRIADSNDAILRLLSTGEAPKGGGAVASDDDLDGKYGDPEIRMRVKDWTGPDFKGRRCSQIPKEHVAFLDQYADLLEWKAGKEASEPEKAKYAPLTRKDAARARGWAARIRAGKVTQAPPEDSGWGEDAGSADAPW
jgi:hypothetical protein